MEKAPVWNVIADMSSGGRLSSLLYMLPFKIKSPFFTSVGSSWWACVGPHGTSHFFTSDLSDVEQ